MKFAKAAGAALLSLSLSAKAEPRLSQVSRNPQIPNRAPVIVDLFGFGRPDIFFNSAPMQGNLEDNALFIRNLGNRTFDHPRFTNFRFSKGGFNDGASRLVTPGQFTGRALFFNVVEPTNNNFVTTPVVVALDALGRIQPRSALASPRQDKWIPVDLDSDGVTEFLEPRYGSEDEFELLLYDRQTDGSYSSVRVPTDSPLSIASALAIDLDGDGDLELVLNPDAGGPEVILERTGARSFSPTPRIIGPTVVESAFDDLNGDGLPDLHTGRRAGFSYSLNLGGLNFASTQSASAPAGLLTNRVLTKVVPQEGASAILRFPGMKDGLLEVLSIRFGTWETVEAHLIDISGISPTSPGAEVIAIEDFDGDGKDDALIISTTNVLRRTFQLNARRLSIAWGNGTGFGAANYIHPAPLTTNLHATGNFDGHPGEDLIIGPDTEGNFAILRNTGEATFPLIRMIPEINPPPGSPEGTIVTGLHSGDIDGDGKTDLAIDYEKLIPGTGYQNSCGIAKGNGDGTFQTPVLPENAFEIVSQNPCGIDQLIDWDGDGDLDAIKSGQWRENLGGRFEGSFRTLIGGTTSVDLFGNPIPFIASYAGDLDGNGFPDIASLVYRLVDGQWGNGIFGGGIPAGIMAVAFNDGNGGIASIAEIPANLAGFDLFGNPVTGAGFFADLNADGLPDLITSEFEGTDPFGNLTGGNYWRRNPGGGSRDPASWVKLPLAGNGNIGAPLLDFDGDGLLEWVSPSGFTRPDPLGPLASPTYDLTSPVSFSSSGFVLSGDFDGDGDADFLYGVGPLDLVLVRNPLVNERSEITRRLIAQGIKGALAGPEKDADGDGRSNFEEIVGRTDPFVTDEKLPDPFALGVSHSTEGDSLLFTIPSGWGNAIHWEYETSTDLQTWMPATTTGDGIFLRDGSILHGLVYFPASGVESSFYRLKATPVTDPF